jgi:predicted dehydrogenase
MTVKVGILGFAHGHVNSYCDEWNKHDKYGIRVVAGWDDDTDRLEAAAGKFQLKAYAEAGALLADAEVQAVIIAAETSMHADLVEQAAAAGKAIVLQKPIALTLAEADRIVSAVNKHGVPFTMAWQMRVDPQNRLMKELLDSGQFGQVFMVRRRHGLSLGLTPGFADSWHVAPQYNRDIWADDASHAIDFLHWLLGVPESVTAELTSQYNPRIPMDNGIAVFRYSGGPLAEVVGSFTCPAHENTTEIVCERGTIIQNYGDSPSCNAPRPEGAIGVKWYSTETKSWTASDLAPPATHSARIRDLTGPLADFLHGRRAPIATAEEGRTSLRMLLACYASTEAGRRVSLNDAVIDTI